MTLIDDSPAVPPAPALRLGSRAQRAKMPIALDVAQAAAIANGVCIRPVAMKATHLETGEVEFIDVPCGSTLASTCPPCAERARRLRVHQCREGWHLDTEPDLNPDQPTDQQIGLVIERADATAAGDEQAMADLDEQLAASGVKGSLDPAPSEPARHRSTRRRDDVPDLPKREQAATTLGRVYDGKDGQVFRPSMFLTLTLPSYGRVRADGTPVNPGTYSYRQAARDAIGFSALVDRFVQNLRRVAGYDVQYFAAVEPQRRLAAHVHFAIRGSIPRAVIRKVVAATYRQIWWPATGQAVYSDTLAPVWHDHLDDHGRTIGGGYYDPATGAELTTWNEAQAQLDQLDDLADEGIGDGAEPFHVLKFGDQIDLQSVLAGTAESERRIGYLAKYLTKSMTEAHSPDPDHPDAARIAAHVDRLHQALQAEPCTPDCPNWLRYGIQPRKTKPGVTPGSCRSKAHKREHLGYGGRRILVSRKWTGKTLADHRHDRRAWVLATLGVDPESPGSGESDALALNDKTRDQWHWEPATPADNIPTLQHRLLLGIADRSRWREAYEAARDGKQSSEQHASATHAADDGEVA